MLKDSAYFLDLVILFLEGWLRETPVICKHPYYSRIDLVFHLYTDYKLLMSALYHRMKDETLKTEMEYLNHILKKAIKKLY